MKDSFYMDSPIGTLCVECEDEYVTGIYITTGEACSNAPHTPFAMKVTREIEDYLNGSLKEFTFSIAMQGTAFQIMVWRELLRIPYGTTATYGDIAKRIGKPAASRAVGMACNRNPLLLAVPCHRVVGAGGKLTGFAVGFERKTFLLEMEKANSTETLTSILSKA